MRRFLPHLLLLAAVALLCLVSAKAWMAYRGPTTLRPQEPAGQSAPAAVPADPADAVPPPLGPRRSVPSAVGSMTARLAVLVLASDDGRPVSGVGVQVEHRPVRGRAGILDTVATDAEGRARFEAETDGWWQVQVGAAGSMVRAEPGRTATVELRIDWVGGADIEVVDEGGAVVAGADVFERVPRVGGEALRALGVTDASGRLSVDGLVEESQLLAVHPGLGRSNAQPFRRYVPRCRRSGERAQVRLVLWTLSGRIAGRVVDAEGIPLESTTIRVPTPPIVRGLADGNHRLRPYPDVVATTDAAGRFVLVGLPADRPSNLHVRHLEHTDAWQEVSPGVEDCVIRLQPGVGLTGRVVDRAGRPVVGCEVRAGDPAHRSTGSVWTSDDGRFELRPVPVTELPEGGPERFLDHSPPPVGVEPGSRGVLVRATAAGRGSASVWLLLEPGVRTLHWEAVLRPQPAVFGAVRDLDGAPLVDWTVRGVVEDLETVSGDSEPRRYQDRTDAEGRFRLEGVLGWHITLEVLAPGESSAHAVRLRETVRIGGAPVDLRIDASPGARVRGRILDAAGTPLDYLVVFLRPVDPEGGAGARWHSGDVRRRHGDVRSARRPTRPLRHRLSGSDRSAPRGTR